MAKSLGQHPEDEVTSPGTLRKHLPKIVFSLLLAGGFVWLLRRGGLPLIPSSEAFAHVRWWAMPAYTAATVLATVSRTSRWLHLVQARHPDVLPRRVYGIGLVGYAMVFIAPLRMGELVRPYLLSRESDLTMEEATATVAAERIIDGLLLSLLLLAGLFWAPSAHALPSHVQGLPLPTAAVRAASYSAAALFTAATLSILAVYYLRGLADRIIDLLLRPLSPALARWIALRADRFRSGLSFLSSPRHALLFFRDTAAIWGGCVLGTYALIAGCGLVPSWSAAAVALSLVGVGSLVPSGPGLFGAFQLSTYCALALYYTETDIVVGGAAFAFLSYSAAILVPVLGGLVGAVILRQQPPPGGGAPAARPTTLSP